MNISKGFFLQFFFFIYYRKQAANRAQHADATWRVFGRPKRSLNDPTIKSRKSEVAKIRQLLCVFLEKKIILMMSYTSRQICTSQLIWIMIFLDISGHNFLANRGLYVAHPDDME